MTFTTVFTISSQVYVTASMQCEMLHVKILVSAQCSSHCCHSESLESWINYINIMQHVMVFYFNGVK